MVKIIVKVCSFSRTTPSLVLDKLLDVTTHHTLRGSYRVFSTSRDTGGGGMTLQTSTVLKVPLKVGTDESRLTTRSSFNWSSGTDRFEKFPLSDVRDCVVLARTVFVCLSSFKCRRNLWFTLRCPLETYRLNEHQILQFYVSPKHTTSVNLLTNTEGRHGSFLNILVVSVKGRIKKQVFYLISYSCLFRWGPETPYILTVPPQETSKGSLLDQYSDFASRLDTFRQDTLSLPTPHSDWRAYLSRLGGNGWVRCWSPLREAPLRPPIFTSRGKMTSSFPRVLFNSTINICTRKFCGTRYRGFL